MTDVAGSRKLAYELRVALLADLAAHDLLLDAHTGRSALDGAARVHARAVDLHTPRGLAQRTGRAVGVDETLAADPLAAAAAAGA
jgi:hypothetical protein